MINRLQPVALAALLLGACGPGAPVETLPSETRGQVFDRYASAIWEKKQAIVAIFHGREEDHARGLPAWAPAPFIKANSSAPDSGNVAILAGEQVRQGIPPPVDLGLNSALADAVRWMDDPLLLSRDTPADPSFEARLKAAAATRYAGIYLTYAYVEPRVLEASGFEVGRLSALATVVDLESENVLAACEAQSEGLKQAPFVASGNGVPTLSPTAIQDAGAALRLDIRNQIAACLAEQTGGKFDLRD